MRPPDIPADDLYLRLELPADAAPEAVEIAWRSLLKQHHPDVAGESSLEEAKRINVAHDWLADPTLRARYDRARSRALVKAPSTRGPSAKTGATGQTRRPGTAQSRGTADRHAHDDDARAPEVGLHSPVVLAFLDRVAALNPDEIDRLRLAEQPPVAFVASIRRFVNPERAAALDAMEALVGERLPSAVRWVPAVRDAATSFGQFLLLAGFLADTLSEPFVDRVEERMTRGWLAAMGVQRYGPRTAEVRALIARARTLTPDQGQRLVQAATALGLTGRLWPHGTDPEEDEVLRVSAALAAQDAAEAADTGGSTSRVQAAVAAYARIAALAPAFGPVEARRLLRPWRDLDRSRAGDPTRRVP